MGGWQPIDTAPKDKDVRILLYCARALGEIRTGHWHHHTYEVDGERAYEVTGWWLDGFDHPFNRPPFMPTHWMPLPEKPEGDWFHFKPSCSNSTA